MNANLHPLFADILSCFACVPAITPRHNILFNCANCGGESCVETSLHPNGYYVAICDECGAELERGRSRNACGSHEDAKRLFELEFGRYENGKFEVHRECVGWVPLPAQFVPTTTPRITI